MPTSDSSEFQQQILERMNEPAYKPVSIDALAKLLKISPRNRPEFLEALAALMSAGRVREGKKGRLRPLASQGAIVGTIKRIASGAGFLIPHEAISGTADKSKDIYISPEDMGDAHTGDEAVVRLLSRRRGGGQRCGRVEEILVRATNVFVGTYFEEAGQGFVQVDGQAISSPVYVGDPGAKGAQPDDKVVIEMLRFPSHTQAGEGVLTKVLGPRGEPGVDTQTIIHEFGLPHEFSEQVLAEARLQAEHFDESQLGDRLDLTGETIVTIDPIDARDFDDAISLNRSKDGHWHLGVHVADVAHFVQPGSPLDQEALTRGTSVYLPGTVIPMLPEVLSNGLASLQEGKVRFTKTVFIEFNPDGVPVYTKFANSAIKVSQRFAYEQVLPILQDPESHRASVPAKVRKLLQQMHELAMLLRKRRFDAGALELQLPEVKLDFDKDGRVTGAHETVHDESHQIIEEFMLAANIAVATALSGRNVPYLRRTHADPDPLKLRNLAMFVNAVGIPFKKFESRPDLQRLLKQVQGHPAEYGVNYGLLRSMKQAEYSASDIGHYALAVSDYCHFTSPIRRYPDLTVHRLIDQLASGAKKLKGPGEEGVARLGKHCSVTERRAANAERELINVKLLTFMQDKLGDELEARITGVEQFGLFCRGIEIPVEGLLHISALERDEFYDYDRATYSLVGRRKGTHYRLGDRIRVSVVNVDVDRRELNFRLAPNNSRKTAARPPATADNAKPRKKKQDTRRSQVKRGKRRKR